MTYEKGYDKGKEAISFLIKVDFNGEESIVKKRFSKFVDLYEKLKLVYDRLPEPPAKTLMKVIKEADLEKRMQGLEKFVKV